MNRKFNFSAGPATLPLEVLQQAQAEMLDWNGTGVSVMEMSHRGKDFTEISNAAEADLRELMSIPSNYKVLFLQGGANSQFSADAAYLHYVYNETIGGLELSQPPQIENDVPLVADLSSTILSRPVDVSHYGMIYAGAQKNIGPAGLNIVIIREDLLGDAAEFTPTMLNYTTHANAGSMYNTPPTYSWYLAGLVFKWIKKQGGLTAMAEINKRKSQKLYDAIDASSFYNNPVDKAYRSWMNVPFTLKDDSLNTVFMESAAERNLVTLKGHNSVGGMRASIYNAMPEEGVDTLIDMMSDFEKTQA